MTFIETIAPQDADGEVRALYERQQAAWGFVPGYARVFSHRPEVLARWARLLAELRRPMDDRRFELVTFVAAHERRNSACALEHGKQLAHLVGTDAVLALARGEAPEPLTETEAVIAGFARKVAQDAASVSAADVDELRRHGLSDAEIFDIAAAVAGRLFFTALLDALGVAPDSTAARSQGEEFRASLAVGRAISTTPVDRLEAPVDPSTEPASD
jgi:uncharacterized peroxidase-related enzyme